MSSRYGLLLISTDYSSNVAELFAACGFEQARLIGPVASVLPGKADDRRVLIGSLNGWTVLSRQFDFNVLPTASLSDLAASFTAGKHLIYFGVEGTSGSHWFEEMNDGQFIRCYCEMEGKPDLQRCLGPRPPVDRYGQVDEWELLRFGLPAPFFLDAITSLAGTEYQFTPHRHSQPKPFSEEKPWWKIF